MKTLGSVTLALMLGFSTTSLYARTLSEVMADMGRQLGRLSRPVNQGVAGASELQVCQDLFTFVREGVEILPSSIESLPEPDRTIKVQRYVELMNGLASSVEGLCVAIADGNTAQSQQELRNILQLRSQGHAEFRL